jgi:hypothetical protein
MLHNLQFINILSRHAWLLNDYKSLQKFFYVGMRVKFYGILLRFCFGLEKE